MTTALLFAGSGVLWLASMAGLANWSPIGRYPFSSMIFFICGFIGMLAMVRTFPRHLSPQKSGLLVFVMALTARVIFVSYPIANDVYRYVWEGAIQHHGFNPYTIAPDNPALEFLASGRLAHIWKSINHKDLPAAYPPISMLLFRGLAAVDPDPFLFKMVMVCFDGATCILLAGMLIHQQLPIRRLLLYAANPLVLLYIAGEGHLDIIQAFFLMASLFLCQLEKDRLGFLALGTAIAVKYLSVIALPFLLSARNKKKSWLVLVPLLTFGLFGDAGPMLFYSLGRFGLTMHYNDSIYAGMRFLFGQGVMPATLICLSVCLIWIYVFFQQRQLSIYLAIGSLLLFIPTLHPWYLILMIPFMSFYPSRAWLYLQAAVAGTFPVIGIEYATGVFQELHWMKLPIYAPFYGLLIWAYLKGGWLFQGSGYPRVQSISVIIPALNEQRWIQSCIRSVMRQKALLECIVVDGGSSDQTIATAKALGAKAVRAQKGRGVQIAAGVQQCRGDVIMILHADCTIAQDTFADVIRRLNSNRHAVGGAVGMRFLQPTSMVWFIAWLNNTRTRLTGIAFGDQAQFFRTATLEAIGEYPAMMLMEDVELSLRLKARGRLLFLKDGITVSSRRWREKRVLGKAWLVLRLFTTYLITRRLKMVDPLNMDYYRTYYGSG